MFRVPKNSEFARLADLIADKFFVQIVHARDRFVVKGNNHIVRPDSRMICRASFVDRNNQHARLACQMVEARDTPMQRRCLARHTNIATSNASLLDQPRGYKLRGVARNRETDSLRRPNHRRVHANHFAGGVRERSSGVSRVQRRVGLDDVVD